VERLLYRPLPTSRSIAIEVVASDEAGRVLASGSTQPLSLRPDRTSSADAVLSAESTSGSDLGAPDLSGDDAGIVTDAAVMPDAAVAPPPIFVSANYRPTDATIADAAIGRPPGVLAGDLLIVLVYADVATTTITPPSSWNDIFSLVGSDTGFVFHGWWRIAVAAEPTTYLFTRSPTNTIRISISAYRGTFAGATPASPPWDAVLTGVTTGNPFLVQTGSTANPSRLLLMAMINDNAPNASWTVPAPWVVRRSGGILLSDQTLFAPGSFGGESVTCGTGSGTNGAARLILPLRPQ
jgi:hypothetical protein